MPGARVWAIASTCGIWGEATEVAGAIGRVESSVLPGKTGVEISRLAEINSAELPDSVFPCISGAVRSDGLVMLEPEAGRDVLEGEGLECPAWRQDE